MIDVDTREALALKVDTSLPGSRTVRVLEQWAQQHAVTLHFIDLGMPVQTAHGESLHGRVRDECLNEH